MNRLLVFLVSLTILTVMLFALPEISYSISETETNVKLYQIKSPRFNGGQPIVFDGKLTTVDGKIIPNAEIVITSDGPCPVDGVIAIGVTDKHGRFRIYTLTQVWDPSDNLITAHAKFLGDETYSPSKSHGQPIVVYPTANTERCVN